MDKHNPSFIIFSGGTACNHIANAFQSITASVCYVLAISDNGGSTSELLRILGGPAIGDLRSRLTRLITTDSTDVVERLAIKELMSYRLPSDGSESSIREEWYLIVDGRHKLWNQISVEKKETIRGFLVAFNSEILKRAHKQFNFRNGSIGNFFLTGARLFFGSLEAAIFLFSAITGIREPTYVLPCINTNHSAAIAAILENGQILRGQCEISHPGLNSDKHCKSVNPIDAFSKLAMPNSPVQTEDESFDRIRNDNLVFSKTADDKLDSAIRRIYYMNEYGQEIYPLPNPKVISHLNQRDFLVYSIGSLYTSLLPNLILRRVGAAISHSPSLRFKVLILNGTPDRETDGYTALEFISTITNALNESQLIDARHKYYDQHSDQHDTLLTSHYYPNDAYPRPVDHGFRQWPPPPPAPLCTQHFHTDNSSSTSLVQHLLKHNGSSSIPGSGASSPGYRTPPFPPELVPNLPPSSYITHLVYLTNSKIPVDVPAIENLGIKCIPVQGELSTSEPRYTADTLQHLIERLLTSSD
ncbi:UPF0052-domain-containing protein [Hesseltinella vesiculosa]|uniref:UPF0052-domain-containing protein n=1 Tax=Hesseltinella vesiculosa TaxID=101127 RepID=A0A1X2GH61_9FUNG|nr:UPF0052-domain-containing protein [Hesseltinella vesiculosa]